MDENIEKSIRRRLDNARRQTWGISPVSRVTKDKKKYNRKALRRIDDDADKLIIRANETAYHFAKRKEVSCLTSAQVEKKFCWFNPKFCVNTKMA